MRILDYIIDAPIPYILVDKLEDGDVIGHVFNSKYYRSAHDLTNEKEKKKFPKGYLILEKLILTLKKNQWLGMNNWDGSIYISSIVPPKLRNEVAFHEHTENVIIKKMRAGIFKTKEGKIK